MERKSSQCFATVCGHKCSTFVEVEKRIKNKSFVAKKAVTYSEEKSVLTKAPITKVKINNISETSIVSWNALSEHL